MIKTQQDLTDRLSYIYYDENKQQLILENHTKEQAEIFGKELNSFINLRDLFQANNETIIRCLKQDNTNAHDKLIKDLESLVKEFKSLLKEKE